MSAEGDVVQHIGVEREGIRVVVRGAARTRGFHGVADVPLLPLGVEEQVAVMARYVDELLAVDALRHGRLALVGGDSEDVVARQGDLPIPLHEGRTEMVLDATCEDLGHVLRHPIAVETGLPLYPVLHPRGVASYAHVELEGTFLQAVFQGQVDGAAVFGQQVGVAAGVPVEVVQRGVSVVVAVAQGKAQGLVERQLVGERRRGKQTHRLAVGPVVTGGDVEVGALEGIAVDGEVGRHQVTVLQPHIVVAPHLLVVPLQLGFQRPALVKSLVEVGDLVQHQGVVERVDTRHEVVGLGVAHLKEVMLVLDEGRRLQLDLARVPEGLERHVVAREVILGPLLEVLVVDVCHDGRQLAVVPLVPRGEREDAVLEEEAHLGHHAVVDELSVALPHPGMAWERVVGVLEVVVRRVAVGLHAEGGVFAVIANGIVASKGIETAKGAFHVEQETVAEVLLVVDVDRATQAAAVVGGATTPVEADVVDQKHGDGAEVDLTEARGVELEAVPKHEGMTRRSATERGRGGAARAIGLDEDRTVLDEQVGEAGGAFRLQHEGVELPRHQGLQHLDVSLLSGDFDGMEHDGVLAMELETPQSQQENNDNSSYASHTFCELQKYKKIARKHKGSRAIKMLCFCGVTP